MDVILFNAPYGTDRDETKDFVDYIDSKGKERRRVPMNYYWDFEDVKDELTKEIDWEERRYEIAKKVVCAQITAPIIPGVAPNPNVPDLVKLSVLIADALISELKKGGER